jgi:signal transduction histidine kinase
MLIVPLLLEGQVIGVLTLYRSKPGQPYTPDDQVLLQDLADRAALLIRNAQLFMQVQVGRQNLEAVSQQLLDVQEVERRSLARELHDGIGQMLTAVKLKLQAARQSNDINRVRIQYAEIIDTVEEALDGVRNLSLDLRPAILDDLGLDSAIRWYLERQTHGSGIHANLISVPLEKRPSPEVEIACFRILQELWTNILRHAQAHSVSVELRETNDELAMTVTDDGKGFSVPEAEENALHGESMGLLNIRERAAHVGGSVDMSSGAGKGTTTVVRIPMHSAGRIT